MQFVGQPFIIGVEEGHIAPFRGRNRRVPRRAGTTIGFMADCLDPAVRFRTLINQFNGVVCRAIVDDDVFPIIERLCTYGIDALGQVARRIV